MSVEKMLHDYLTETEAQYRIDNHFKIENVQIHGSTFVFEEIDLPYENSKEGHAVGVADLLVWMYKKITDLEEST